MMDAGQRFKMTLKTRLFLWLHNRFHKLGQWFINHCDVVPPFREPCRFGGFCLNEKLYNGCINDERMKNNWMCWRDGVLEETNEPKKYVLVE
ncbi:unnamed protein product [marine sediment metagenome]|uniref:Uncharacterized protein n=1 Tax=marine sediment metagenome TaxID=412755 RepID=X1CUR5_9ZZZZ